MKKILWAVCLMAALSLAGCSDDENGNGGNGGNGGSGEGGNPSGGDLGKILEFFHIDPTLARLQQGKEKNDE